MATALISALFVHPRRNALELSCYVDSDSLARDFVATVGGQAIGKVVGELMTLGVIFILLQMILR